MPVAHANGTGIHHLLHLRITGPSTSDMCSISMASTDCSTPRDEKMKSVPGQSHGGASYRVGRDEAGTGYVPLNGRLWIH